MNAAERAEPVRVRVVVADESEARFYDITRPGGPLQPCGRVANPAARLHDRDLKSDRPGRVFDRAPPAAGRRGAGAHHATGGERRPRVQEAQRFARRIARELTETQQRQQFDRLVLMAGPRFLGVLRVALRKSVPAVVTEVPRDLVHQDERAVRDHIPEEVFLSTTRPDGPR
ncbi:MAG TPA: host attachment protein [Steroidobacteraceae bacterium]|nr:host attachment protein [Steroidobacteraceae bacterium]